MFWQCFQLWSFTVCVRATLWSTTFQYSECLEVNIGQIPFVVYFPFDPGTVMISCVANVLTSSDIVLVWGVELVYQKMWDLIGDGGQSMWWSQCMLSIRLSDSRLVLFISVVISISVMQCSFLWVVECCFFCRNPSFSVSVLLYFRLTCLKTWEYWFFLLVSWAVW